MSVSTDVALTAKTPSSIVSSETSNDPQPRTKIRMFRSPREPLSSPYAIAAVIGSLMIRMTFRPAISPSPSSPAAASR